jgi:hypothetical protein
MHKKGCIMAIVAPICLSQSSSSLWREKSLPFSDEKMVSLGNVSTVLLKLVCTILPGSLSLSIPGSGSVSVVRQRSEQQTQPQTTRHRRAFHKRD